MGRRIGERFDKVVATAHHRTVGYNYRTDLDLCSDHNPVIFTVKY